MDSHKELNQKWKYDVFLSFRGEDTRNGFVSHLHKRLENTGINVFKDDVKLERGKHIATALIKAIEESRIAIIIFSENYVSSKWCLEELANIMECVETKGQEVIPIFYNVDPSHVRTQSNGVAIALGKHQVDLKGSDVGKVQRWKDALCKAANIAGWDVGKTANGNEAECIDRIIIEKFQNLHRTVSANEKYLVGIESRSDGVESLLKVGLGGVHFVGVWGMGGVGKTTVARKIFDSISNQFQGSCFLANVREDSKKNGMKHLQMTLLSRILNEKSMNIASFYEGADMIKRKLCLRKVLIVFDDVDNDQQLEYLVGKHDWFGDGSRVITTTRNADLLRCHDELYSVPELAKYYAKGLPLALKVLGSFLYKRGITDWRSTLDRLKDTGCQEIVKQLSLSLDGLAYEDKNIFLDIACFFRGKRRDEVITILNSFGFKSEIGMDVLTKKSLIYISEGMVEMHDLIEQMGQQAARDVDRDKPWNHSRIWHEKDIETVFHTNQWTESVKGIMVPIGSDQHICKWSKAFRNMPCLRLLIVKGEEVRHYEPVSDTIKHLSSSLKWLDWSYYSFESLPASFQPRNLVGLNMTFSSLVEICKEPKELDDLFLDSALTIDFLLQKDFSENLLRTPNFSEIPNLQRIVLKSCLSLVEVHPSIGNLKKLISLNMTNCKNLKFLLSSIQMESLESLNLCGCEKLEALPEIKGNMESLSELLLGCTAIRELPSSIGSLLGIILLDFHSCENLVRLPASVSKMKKMKVLILKGCSNLSTLPESLGDLEELEQLYAGNTAIWQLPDSMEKLSKLKILSLKSRRGIKSQFATGMIFPCAFNGLKELRSLDLSGCNLSGDEINALTCLTTLAELNLSRNKFISLPDRISQLCQLQYLDITHCQELKQLPKLPRSMKELYAEDFLAKQSILALSIYPRLYLVSFTNYSFNLQPYTEKRNDNSVLDQILSLSLSDTSDDRMSYSIIFPGHAIPTWFKHQSIEEKILLKLPQDWYDNRFKGFAICCVTCMGAGVNDPDSGLSGKYDHTFIKAKLLCNNHPEELKVLEKECKVSTTSRNYSWCVCFAYIPLRSFLQFSDSEVRDFNQYGVFEASIQRKITRQWGVHLIYKSERQFFESRTEKKLFAEKLSQSLIIEVEATSFAETVQAYTSCDSFRSQLQTPYLRNDPTAGETEQAVPGRLLRLWKIANPSQYWLFEALQMIGGESICCGLSETTSLPIRSEIKQTIHDYYSKLYSTDHLSTRLRCQLNPSSFGSIPSSAHSTLDSPPTLEEKKKPTYSFKPHKDPGPDGMHPFMYQKYWATMAPLLLDFCNNSFNTCSMDERANTTYLCLISKCKNASSLKNFRPIGLCNTQYKIVTKIIVNRIKPFLQQIIGPSQASFLPNRRAVDHAIIVQEYLSHFKKMSGIKSNMIIKIDLETSFDRLEWSFIRQALTFFNFSPLLSRLIMSCISTSSISVLVNGSLTSNFKPTRGIRQGDIALYPMHGIVV
ncbi:hypothetical protein BC332_16134 [Capsicum chinense]|nr:hypothetical protein BC332_16134 [Capsicum chinense]